MTPVDYLRAAREKLATPAAFEPELIASAHGNVCAPWYWDATAWSADGALMAVSGIREDLYVAEDGPARRALQILSRTAREQFGQHQNTLSYADVLRCYDLAIMQAASKPPSLPNAYARAREGARAD